MKNKRKEKITLEVNKSLEHKRNLLKIDTRAKGGKGMENNASSKEQKKKKKRVSEPKECLVPNCSSVLDMNISNC